MQENSDRLELLPNGEFFLVQETRTSLGARTAVIQALQSDLEFIVPNFMFHDGFPVSASLKGNNFVIWCRLKKLVINCAWRVLEGNLVMDPLTRKDRIARDWLAPENMELFFMVRGTRGTEGENVYKFGVPGRQSVHLWCRSTEKSKAAAGWFRLPLPNTYEDGSMCLGSGDGIYGPSMTDVLLEVKGILDNAPYASDVLDREVDHPARNLLFYYDMSGEQIMPGAKWHTNMTRVNNTYYSLVG
jgi:hypothetical protein